VDPTGRGSDAAEIAWRPGGVCASGALFNLSSCCSWVTAFRVVIMYVGSVTRNPDSTPGDVPLGLFFFWHSARALQSGGAVADITWSRACSGRKGSIPTGG